MTGPEDDEGTELLERAIGYALCSVRPVTPALLSHPTPCHGWDLRMLLQHASDSLAALQEGGEEGCVGVLPAPEVCGDPVASFRARASRLLGVWAAGRSLDGENGGGGGGCAGRIVTVADWPLAAAVVAQAGALEIAVHGWDIARATGLPRPIPPALATELLRTARALVPEPTARQPLFALPVAMPPQADPSDRLVAFLGRDPGRC